MIFIDTSALVKLYLREDGAETMRAIIASGAHKIFISDHVFLETLATFAYKLRNQTVNGRRYRRMRSQLFAELPGGYRFAPVDAAILRRAMELADIYRALGVGTVDLIHVATAERLAVAEGERPTIVCADRAMRNLAAAAGFGVFNPETDDPAALVSMN